MSETKALFDVLRRSADSTAAAAIERLVQEGRKLLGGLLAVRNVARGHGVVMKCDTVYDGDEEE